MTQSSHLLLTTTLSTTILASLVLRLPVTSDGRRHLVTLLVRLLILLVSLDYTVLWKSRNKLVLCNY